MRVDIWETGLRRIVCERDFDPSCGSLLFEASAQIRRVAKATDYKQVLFGVIV